MTPPLETLETALAGHPSCTRTAKELFTRLTHRPSGNPIHIGFRCFSCPLEPLLAAFATGDLAAVAALPLAVDDNGSPAINTVRIDLAHVPGGDLVAAQPLRYTDYVSEPAAPALILEGAAARELADLVRRLDQTR